MPSALTAVRGCCGEDLITWSLLETLGFSGLLQGATMAESS